MRALDDVDVVSLGQIYNGPYCSLMLAYLGADVVKVEPPDGENLRFRDDGGHFTPETCMLNSTKDSVTLNLKADRGKELFKDLVAEADVLVENYRVGAMEDLGLGYETLSDINPELIYAHGSGYGEYGPYRDRPAMDLTVQAMTGVMDTTGFPENPPVKTGVQVGDFMGGIHLFGAIVSALYQRERTGEGQFVEVAMMDAVYPTMMSPMGAYYRTPEAPPRTGNHHSGLALAPYNVYEAADGWVAIICSSNRHWDRLAPILGREDLADNEDYATHEKRSNKMEEIDNLVEEWTIERERDEIVDILLEGGVPVAPVQERNEVLFDPHLEARDMVNEIDHPHIGEVRVPGLPMKLHGSEDPEIRPAQVEGESNEEVYGALGLTEDEIRELADAGII
ncbi:MAG: CaiB/BaiF CoA transferase family protein [Salinirussus sp.]